MQILKTPFDDVYELQPHVITDERGMFVKIFQNSLFSSNQLDTRFVEEYYSISSKYVLRGLHFQLPPADHIKYVCCISGNIFDVVLDIRKGSPTFGEYYSVYLSSEKRNGIYIGKGFAHGFLSLADNSTLLYKATSEYSQECDSGILWNSANICWPYNLQNYIVSKRDMTFPPFEKFDSPFIWRRR